MIEKYIIKLRGCAQFEVKFSDLTLIYFFRLMLLCKGLMVNWKQMLLQHC